MDWHQLQREQHPPVAVVDPRRRLRTVLAGFGVLLAVVFIRSVQLEVSQGAAFRAEAARPIRREISLPGVRGRILAADGSVLAYDRKTLALAVHFRYLQDPPDPRWLRRIARARLPKPQRKDRARLEAEQDLVRAERGEQAGRLARLCGLTIEQWTARAGEVQARVERIARRANERRRRAADRGEEAEAAADDLPLLARLTRALHEALEASMDDGPPPRITVAEELDYHVMAEDVPPEAAAEIEGHPERYPGVKITERTRRTYPFGPLAAHVLGHIGREEADAAKQQEAGRKPQANDDPVGRMGVERQYEPLLCGRRGLAVELNDHGGRLISAGREQEPGTGRDLVLTLDLRVQRAAEELLDSALERRAARPDQAEPAGGAIVVMDVAGGALVAAASAPRFDPGLFAGGDSSRRTALLTDPGHPLFDRVTKMALPPGSVFKTLTAIALLESGVVEAEKPLHCQGYLHQPDRQRCAVFVHEGVGHGDVGLADALALSCNVYFFHHAGRLGAGPLVDWAGRLGFGRPTGVDLPGEAAGTLPTPGTIERLERHAWRTWDTQAVAVGQGSLTATPLQIARLMAAVANGGRLVTPHVVQGAKSELAASVPGLHPSTLTAIRTGLERVVADAQGTAHASVYLDSIAIAGKTGTAATGEGSADHAWFAGYVPADLPRFAIVVVLEHSGDSATAAGPVVKRLVLRMRELGVL